MFSECFLDGLWSGVGVVLSDLSVPKRRSKAKGWICGNGCFTYEILTCSGVVASIWGARKREKGSAKPIWIPTRFGNDFRSILGVILHPKTPQGSMRNFILVRAKKITLSRRKGDAIWGRGPWGGSVLGVVCLEQKQCKSVLALRRESISSRGRWAIPLNSMYDANEGTKHKEQARHTMQARWRILKVLGPNYDFSRNQHAKLYRTN